MKIAYLLFLLMAASLMTACGANHNATATLPPSPEQTQVQEPAVPSIQPSSTQEPEAQSIQSTSTQEPTPVPVVVETNPDQANANVIHVRAVLAGDGSWTFHVTVEHPDTGWDDYADGWDVVTPDGAVLKVTPTDTFTRLLAHPHENEQPFTRSQSGITIPAGITQVRVRAHDIVSGFGGDEVLIDLEKDSGPGYEVER